MNEGRAAALRRRVVRKNKLAVVLDRTALCRQRRETIAQPRPPLHALNDARLQFASVEEAVIVADGRRFDAAEQHRRVKFHSRIAGSLLRSEERRVGKECGIPSRFRWTRFQYKKNM